MAKKDAATIPNANKLAGLVSVRSETTVKKNIRVFVAKKIKLIKKQIPAFAGMKRDEKSISYR